MVEENTAEYYRNMLDKHIIPGIGKILLRDLAPKDLDKFYNNLRNKPRKPLHDKEKVACLSWNSIKKINSIISNSLKYAMRNKKILTNAAALTSLPKKGKNTHLI